MKKILLVSHISDTPGGPFEKFRQYLQDKYILYKITHPISLNSEKKSTIDVGEKIFRFKIPSFLQYPLEGVYTLVIWYSFFKNPQKIDLAICFDSLAYFHTYLLKKLLGIEKIVYYNVDYSKKRFSNVIMNFIYHKITRFSYYTCDYFFSFNNKFIEEIDPAGKYSYKQINLKPLILLRPLPKLKKIPYSLIYIGAIDYRTTDFEPMFLALGRLRKENIAFRLDIYSNISSTSPIHDFIKKLSLEKNIFFKGTVDNITLTEKILPRYYIGVAPYATKDNPSSPDHAFMNKDLTGRVVEFIGAGLPVVGTRIIDEFRMIDNNKFGFSVISVNDWYRALKTLLKNEALYKDYSKNAYSFAKNYDASILLKPIFSKILQEN